MKSSLACLCLSAAAYTVGAIQLHKREDGLAPRVLGFELNKRHVADPFARDARRRRRRDNTLSADLDNEQTLYFMNVTIGTPPKSMQLHIDTGSSDLWVNTPDSRLCQSRGDPCSVSGDTYSANDSSTYEYVNSNFNISYADGSGAVGDYATEVFHIGDEEIKDLQFAIGYQSSSPQSLCGIGYTSIEADTTPFAKPYDNLPAKLVSDGTIASNAYSLWLNDLDSNTGNLLFGGVDRAQYRDELVTLPIQQIQGGYYEFLVELTGLYFNGQSVLDDDSSESHNVLLDSGTSLTYLPDSIVQSMFDAVNADYSASNGFALVDCSLADQKVNVTYRFGNAVSIEVDISELVLETTSVTNDRGRPHGKRGLGDGDDPFGIISGDAPCAFGIAPAGSGTLVLGDTFLRSAYVVYDLDNNEISLAQSNLNSTKSQVVEIGTGENAVPNASGVSPTTDNGGDGSSSSDDNDDDDSAASVLGTPTVLGAMVVPMLVGFVGFLI